MNESQIMVQNWLTLKPKFNGWFPTLLLTLFTLIMTFLSWYTEAANFKANSDLVLNHQQYFKLWTTLFIHADFSHLLSNLLLLIPLIYLISSYYSSVFLIFMAILSTGLMNWIVLQTLSPEVFLIGISGLVNWLAALWLILFYLIDLRENRRKRFAVVLFVSFVLFVPETFKPEISYLSHFIGYILGVISALIYFNFNKLKFKKVEVYEKITEEVFNSITESPH